MILSLDLGHLIIGVPLCLLFFHQYDKCLELSKFKCKRFLLVPGFRSFSP